MNNYLYKQVNSIIEHYVSVICINEKMYVENEIKIMPKIKDAEFICPSISNYKNLYNYNYSIQQLKNISKKYHIRVHGNKKEMYVRIFTYFKIASSVLKIQKVFRGSLQRINNKLRGPAFMNRLLCNNTADFFTMDELTDLEPSHFFSYKDIDGFIYGFNIISLYNLIIKTGQGITVKNPYNRNNIHKSNVDNVFLFLKISKILKVQIDINIKNSVQLAVRTAEQRALDLFIVIDSLGNYSNPDWFLSLNIFKLFRFMREISDIWNYRINIPIETKQKIYPPHGNLFMNFNMTFPLNEININFLRERILDIMERLVNSGVDNDSKYLGSTYLLGALTIVNEDAASALPWLYQSFSYFN